MTSSLRTRRLAAIALVAALVLPVSPAQAATRVVVPFAAPIPVRDAAPLVMSGDTPLGFGRVAADRRSVVLETRAAVDTTDLRVVWSGGAVPSSPGARAAAERPGTAAGPTDLPAGIRTARGERLDPLLPDPGRPGPFATTRASYRLGDTSLRVPTGYRVEVTGEVTYPRLLGTRRHPVVVLLHGRHGFCGRAGGEETYDWPCPAGFRPIPSQSGYRGLADLLASHGMVVISVAANGINAQDDAAADGGAVDRGFLVLHHLQLWRGWAGAVGTGPFGSLFRGKLDFTDVGLMGHSRGGEGIVAALAANGEAANRFGIKAVLPLAPVNFSRFQVRGTPSLTVVPYCDGDVSDLEGVHFFDDATITRVDGSPHGLLGVFGANHNFFNAVWTPGGWEAGTFDDWYDPADRFCGSPQRLTAPQQVAAGNAYMAAFFRARLQGLHGYDRLFHGSTATPPSARPATTVASWSGATGRRLLVNDLRAADVNALGGATTATGFDAALRCGGDSRYAGTCLGPRGPGDEPHLGLSYLVPTVRGLAQMHLVWSRSGATWANTVPAAYGDVRPYRYVTVRIARDAWALSDAPPVLCLRLQDSSGTTRTVRLSGPALTTPVYTDPNPDPYVSGAVPHALVISVPVRLAEFHGVDLQRLRSVSLVGFGAGNITVGDVSFQR